MNEKQLFDKIKFNKLCIKMTETFRVSNKIEGCSDEITERGTEILNKIQGKFGCYEDKVIDLISVITGENLKVPKMKKVRAFPGTMLYFTNGLDECSCGTLGVVTHLTREGINFLSEDSRLYNVKDHKLVEMYNRKQWHIATDIPMACEHFLDEDLKRFFGYVCGLSL